MKTAALHISPNTEVASDDLEEEATASVSKSCFSLQSSPVGVSSELRVRLTGKIRLLPLMFLFENNLRSHSNTCHMTINIHGHVM